MIKKRKFRFTSDIDFNQFEPGSKNINSQEYDDDAKSNVDKNGNYYGRLGKTNVNASTLSVSAKINEQSKLEKVTFIYEQTTPMDEAYRKEKKFEDYFIFIESKGKYTGYKISNTDNKEAFPDIEKGVKIGENFSIDDIEKRINEYTTGAKSNNKSINISYDVFSFGKNPLFKGNHQSHEYYGKGNIDKVAPELYKVLEWGKSVEGIQSGKNELEKTRNDFKIKNKQVHNKY